MNPRVLFVSSLAEPPYWGGSEKYWFDTITHPEFRSRFEATALLRKSEVTTERARELGAVGVEVNWWKPVRGKTSGFRARLGRAVSGRGGARRGKAVAGDLVSAVRHLQPDLVWLNLAGPSPKAVPAGLASTCTEMGIPLWIILQHAPDHFFFRNDEQTDGVAREFLGATRIVCIADRNRGALERALGHRLQNVWMSKNSLPTRFWELGEEISLTSPVLKQGTARLLNLARFDPHFKGQHILLEVLADDRWKARDWHLTMQGGGRLAGLLERLIKYYSIPAERIEQREHCSNVHAAIGNADLLVMPSLSEGTPFALVEAMACGRAAVGTPVGGIPELVQEGITGWLARSSEFADFGDAMERAWSARQRWADIGAVAKVRARGEYNQENAIASIISWMEEDLEMPGGWSGSRQRDAKVMTIAGA